ncbi:MAG: transketolase [Clostridiales bacterium]|nr:transketolase [Clostridiales bacterium]
MTETLALEKIANNVRIDILEEVYNAKSGHIGGAFSIVDILTVLYFNEMNIDAKSPDSPDRDRLVLSKGHASAALYAVLAEKGYIDKEELKTFRNIDSNLQGHPDMNKVPGVDMTTGSLGQGLSVANGMALSSKLDSRGYRVYCILGDGELQEGQIWEAAMTAEKYQLDNLCVIIDANELQLTDTTMNVKGINQNDIEQKFRAFGFQTVVIDGHNIESIIRALTIAEMTKGKPTAIICKTIKGKGVSFMENQIDWHGKAPNDEEYKIAMKELKQEAEKIQEKITNREV